MAPVAAAAAVLSRRRWLQQGAGSAALLCGARAAAFRAAAFGAAAIGAAAIGGCSRSDFNHKGADAPASGPLPRVPRLAWVFSSGGPRCFVHIGVLKALEELGLKPDLVVGASGGALVGVLWASGCRAQELETLALEFNPVRLARLAIGASERLSGSGVADLVREHARQPLLERLPTMAVCVAQRLVAATGNATSAATGAATASAASAAKGHGDDSGLMGFNRGDVGLAVQAACAIEGQFAPVLIDGQRYADADLVTPLPVRLARGLGAQRVMAVDASAHETRAPAGTERWRAGDLKKRALTAPDARAADLLLHPDFGYFVSFSREFRERCIAVGYRDTLAAAQALRALHAA